MSGESSIIDYTRLVSEALMAVVRQVLQQVSEQGLPAGHHFYVTFATRTEGVELAPALRARYPEEMTVVLQHRFHDLSVDEEAFAVTLSFSGEPQRVRVPWTAIRSFADPGAEIGFRFGGPGGGEPAELAGAGGSADNVVQLDRFRREKGPQKK